MRLDLKSLKGPLIGVDEVGRGCLAGPVTAAAVIFNSTKDNRKYRDSKILTEEEREVLSLSVHTHHQVAIGWASVEEIDEINILQASFLAMRRAIAALGVKEGTILVDGHMKIPGLTSEIGTFEQHAIIGGDDKLRVISAASIAAKVARDNFMKSLAKEINGYGFEQNKGYGTKFHRARILEVGTSKWHRKSFSGVKEHILGAEIGAEGGIAGDGMFIEEELEAALSEV